MSNSVDEAMEKLREAIADMLSKQYSNFDEDMCVLCHNCDEDGTCSLDNKVHTDWCAQEREAAGINAVGVTLLPAMTAYIEAVQEQAKREAYKEVGTYLWDKVVDAGDSLGQKQGEYDGLPTKEMNILIDRLRAGLPAREKP